MQDRLDAILDTLQTGGTVYVETMTRITKVTPRHFQNWRSAGRELFRLGRDGSLNMARGKGYDDISFCRISFEGGTRRPREKDKE